MKPNDNRSSLRTASEAKQEAIQKPICKSGLLRRYAPRNDEQTNKQINNIMKKIKYIILCLALSLCADLYSQDTVSVAVRSNVRKDMIQLRWAATSVSSWYYTVRNGIIIERYTLVSNGQTLAEPEKKILTSEPLKPRPLNDWEQIATDDGYAAIIAQALYGDTFEISGGTKDIAEIIALSQEQEQRYAMAMYAADMSYDAAMFAGWAFNDRDVRHGERYLYRVIPVSADADRRVETGSVFVGLDDYQELPKPLELDAIFGNSTVMLTWNFEILEKYYSSYFVERSENGKDFRRLTTMPLTNITGGSRMFRVDSIENNKRYYYRITGITPFGDESPYSDTVYGEGRTLLIYVPQILKAVPDDKGVFNVFWDFDERGNIVLSHFELQRSDTDRGEYITVISDISPKKRNVLYRNPQPENYLRIAAIPKEGEPTYSFPFLLQIPDSIPPAAPKGLQGYIDTTGTVFLSWNSNTETDILGYRIFRGQTAGEEFVPLTDIAVTDTVFIDTVDVRNLNPKVYYSISALDKRYNQSALCTAVEITKPVLIKPSPPYITKFEATEEGVRLEWVTGRDESLASYIVYRGAGKADSAIAEISDLKYTDMTAVGGKTYYYAVSAKNIGDIESDISPEVYVRAKFMKNKDEKIKKFTGRRVDSSIVLQWEHTITNVKSINIYRKVNDDPLTKWQETEVHSTRTVDINVNSNSVYEYLLVIRDMNGKPASVQIKVK
jgi:fibronectin type 3 domain-containing protein